MSKKPWMTSDTLVSAVQRKISMPVNQATFSVDDILAFADEEMVVSQVPSIMVYNEEYFVTTKVVPLEENVTRYPIPERAIGMKLRDVAYADSQGNLSEMTRLSPDNKTYFQDSMSSFNSSAKAFYLEGNDLVISPNGGSNLTGYLVFYYYLRPNQLVQDSHANIVDSFQAYITVDNSNLTDGDTLTIADVVFTAVSSSPVDNEFLIDATSILTATNLMTVINASSLDMSANNNSTAIVDLDFTDIELMLQPISSTFAGAVSSRLSSTSDGLVVGDNAAVVFEEEIDQDLYTVGDLADFLETSGGHRTLGLDIEIQDISLDKMEFTLTEIPLKLVVGDYVCSQYECIIPQIPSDLHSGLAERTSARILASIGDQQGLATVNTKIGEINQTQGTLLDNRVEGAPLKINNQHSLLRYSRNRR